MTNPHIKQAASLLGGEVYGRDNVRCPGPGHSRHDRSLVVTFHSNGSFAVHSFAVDDWRLCKDHVHAILGLGNGFRRAANDDQRPASNDNTSPGIRDLIDEKRRVDKAASIWGSTVPIPGTLAETYL